ncbi:MAG: ABC transporter ATP-binding protein [Niastella sp.]|nr:ABC transporter ATP-binding protein [Niastella sp.]
MPTVIKVENISKQYRLGNVGTGSLSHDINRTWHRMRGKEDPYLKIGEANNRAVKGNSEYVWALQDINFEVKQGEVLGIIGRNGAGKSTLLKILSRTTTPTTGQIKIKGRVASLLEVGTGFHPELTGRENIYLNGAILGMTKAEIKSKFDEIVDFAGVERYIDTPVKRYSSGMYVRLAFGVAAHLEPEILIVDEVLAVGDAEFQKKALGKMKDVSAKDGRTVLFVSHNMPAIKRLCSHGILLENGNITLNTDINTIVEHYLNYDKSEDCIPEAFFENSGKVLQVQSCQLLDQNLKLVTKYYDVNDKIILKVRYRFLEKIPRVNLTVIIYNSELETVYFLDRRDYYQQYAAVEAGEYESLIEIPNPLLKPGKYSVTIGCGNIENGEQDHKFYVLSFIISNVNLVRATRDGYLFLPLKWDLNIL